MFHSNILIDTNVTQTDKCIRVSQPLSTVDADFFHTQQMRKLKQALRQFAEDSRDTITIGISFQIRSLHWGDGQEINAAP